MTTYSLTPGIVCAMLCATISLMVQQGSAQTLPSRPQYFHPSAGAVNVSRTTNIAIRPGVDLSGIRLSADMLVVRGERSGAHVGTVTLSDDRKTILLNLARPFEAGERVRAQ